MTKAWFSAFPSRLSRRGPFKKSLLQESKEVDAMKWRVPVLQRIAVQSTARGNGPCPDGDGGSEAM